MEGNNAEFMINTIAIKNMQMRQEYSAAGEAGAGVV
jgi:hypothetical protein